MVRQGLKKGTKRGQQVDPRLLWSDRRSVPVEVEDEVCVCVLSEMESCGVYLCIHICLHACGCAFVTSGTALHAAEDRSYHMHQSTTT